MVSSGDPLTMCRCPAPCAWPPPPGWAAQFCEVHLRYVLSAPPGSSAAARRDTTGPGAGGTLSSVAPSPLRLRERLRASRAAAFSGGRNLACPLDVIRMVLVSWGFPGGLKAAGMHCQGFRGQNSGIKVSHPSEDSGEGPSLFPAAPGGLRWPWACGHTTRVCLHPRTCDKDMGLLGSVISGPLI